MSDKPIPALLADEEVAVAEALRAFYRNDHEAGRAALRRVRAELLPHLYTAGLALGISADSLAQGEPLRKIIEARSDPNSVL